MQRRSSSSVQVFYPELGRPEVIKRLSEGLEELKERLPVVRVVLFGSYARGNYTVGSDIDLLIVYAGQARPDAYALVKRTFDLLHLEPHLYTETEYETLHGMISKMVEDGIILLSRRSTGARSTSKCAQLILKRLLDMAASVGVLVLLAIPFAIITLAIKLGSTGPVFFRQERVGQGGRLFRVWKFRTMVEGAEQQGLGYNIAQDDPRITRVGHFLRTLGLDELPQLINVLKGDMSLVGPRPTLLYQVQYYNEFQRQRLKLKPGITSLAVVSGRNALSWQERIKLDVWYVANWSFWLDLKILFKTPWVVLIKRQGIYGEGGVNDPFVDPTTPQASSQEKPDAQ